MFLNILISRLEALNFGNFSRISTFVRLMYYEETQLIYLISVIFIEVSV